MCLAVPTKVIRVNGMIATVDAQGARRDISLLLIPDEVSIGDYVLVHAGFAIQKLDDDAAKESLRLIEEMLKEQKDSY